MRRDGDGVKQVEVIEREKVSNTTNDMVRVDKLLVGIMKSIICYAGAFHLLYG